MMFISRCSPLKRVSSIGSPSYGLFRPQRNIVNIASLKPNGYLADSLFNPTPEHKQLREMVANFARDKVGPQARKYDELARLNLELFREVGNLGLLGITLPEKDGLCSVSLPSLSSTNKLFCFYFFYSFRFPPCLF